MTSWMAALKSTSCKGQQDSSLIAVSGMDPSHPSCGLADMPSCSPRCLRAAKPIVLGRPASWFLPSQKCSRRHRTAHVFQPAEHRLSQSIYGGRLVAEASSAEQSAAPFSLEVDTTQQSEKADTPEHIPGWRNTLYAILCIALVLGCASQSQPGPAFASLTISSSTLGKEGNAPCELKKAFIAPLLLMTLLQRLGRTFLRLSSQKLCTGLRAAVRSAWAGLGAGFLHTLSGPDHLAVGVYSYVLLLSYSYILQSTADTSV